VLAPARPLVPGGVARGRPGRSAGRLGDGLRRPQGRVQAAVRAAGPSLPQRHPRPGKPDQREPGRLDLGEAQALRSAAERGRGPRDLHLRLPLPRLSTRAAPPAPSLLSHGRPAPAPPGGRRQFRAGLHKAGRKHTPHVASHKMSAYAASHHRGDPQGSPAMSYQFNEQLSAYTRQFASVAARVSRLALENAETLFGVQLRTLEKNVEATTSYLGERAEARDLDAYRNLLPKGLQIARDNAERVAAAGQEVIGLTLKTGEALGELAKNQFEAATSQVQATVAKAARKR